MGDKTDQDDNEYTNLYIGNIPYSSTEKDVKNFIQYDGCKITMVTDKNTGKTKGFAFVAFETHEQALEIKNKLQGKELEGRPIILKWDRGLQSKVSDKSYKLFVINLFILYEEVILAIDLLIEEDIPLGQEVIRMNDDIIITTTIILRKVLHLEVHHEMIDTILTVIVTLEKTRLEEIGQ
ncbi:Hypothetical protein EHI5A_103370 [Entamoeba histolytica KU27]|uniref:RRM domain-containing protein n=1 Tax=Entamoeba histolytica KU27 TaxID=885311 RepID=M2S419_ENTHI|nr:Hypothetical protein EHI5A_103370 [Entamoeba histolytica KU27]